MLDGDFFHDGQPQPGPFNAPGGLVPLKQAEELAAEIRDIVRKELVG